MAKRSTDSARAVVARALVLNALDVAYVPEATCVAVGKQLGITGNAALVRAALIDSARIASELGCASGALLAVLEAVAGAGGQLTEVNLVALLAKRFGWEVKTKFSPEEKLLMEEEKFKHRTLTVLGTKGKAVGFVSLSDAIRPTAIRAINELKKMSSRTF